MLVPVYGVTVPGGPSATIDLQFATAQNQQLASDLLDQIYAAANSGSLNVQNDPTKPPSNPNDLNVFVLGFQGGIANTGPDAATVPTGYLGIIDAFGDPAATIPNSNATISGATQSNESVVSGQGNLTFYLNGGSGTLIAGGGNNLVAPGPNAPATGGSWQLFLDGGNNTVYGTIGSFLIDDGSSGDPAGSNQLFLGSGADTVLSWGTDSIMAAPGGTALIATYHPGTVVYGNTGASTIVDGGGDTVVQGSGPETIFADAGGGVYYGGLGQLTFVSAPDVYSTVVAAQGNALLFGAPGSNGLFYVGSGQFELDGGGGSQTVVGSATSSGALIFSENGGSITLAGDSNSNVLVAGAGNVTLNAGPASGANVLYAGTGNDFIVGGSGNDVIVGGPGSDTLVGGGGANAFVFNASFAAGGNEVIADWNSNDQLDLYGFGTPTKWHIPHGTSITLVNGSKVMTLPDGTSITFLGVSTIGTAHIHSS